MSHRGRKAFHEHVWERELYAHGVADGLQGRQARCSDQFYQRGYRRGCARRKRSQKCSTEKQQSD